VLNGHESADGCVGSTRREKKGEQKQEGDETNHVGQHVVVPDSPQVAQGLLYESAMTLTVLSLNTAVDRTLVVPDLALGGISRAREVYVEAGGKGLNVARVLRQLGEPVHVAGFLGGKPAPFIRARCDALGIEQHWVETAGDSRTCLILVDGKGGHPTVVNEDGPAVRDTEVDALRRLLDAVVKPGDIACLSGSVPPGVPDGLVRDIVSSLQTRGIRVLVDTSEARLGEALAASPWAVTPTAGEAAGALGPMPPADLAGALAVRACHVILTRGARGAIYACGGDRWQLTPPAVVALNPIASGDALAAGFLHCMEEGASGLESARFAVACGTANAARIAPGIPSPAEVEAVAAAVMVERIGEGDRDDSRPPSDEVSR
jgi:1-phosphofructokinase family hexose kinase